MHGLPLERKAKSKAIAWKKSQTCKSGGNFKLQVL